MSVQWTASIPARTSPNSSRRRCCTSIRRSAIYESIDATPSHQQDLVEANAVYRNGDADTMAQAEAIVAAHVAAHADIMAIPAAERQAAHARF